MHLNRMAGPAPRESDPAARARLQAVEAELAGDTATHSRRLWLEIERAQLKRVPHGSPIQTREA